MSDRDVSRVVKNQAMPQERHLKQAFELCVRKTRTNIKRLADHPKAYGWAVDGNYSSFPDAFFYIWNWTSSFFTGMALLAWSETGDDYFLKQVQRLAPFYHDKVFKHYMDTMHDLGFLYSLYSVALYRLTGEKAHRETGLRAADVLAKRFVPNGAYIRAWGRMDDPDPFTAGMMIIDCLMNLPLLYWASVETGNGDYRDIATRHADTALQYLVRSDDTVYHAYRFDVATGKPLRADTYGGCTVESHWARGTAWAIYGFALSYNYTRDPRHLDASLRLARKFIANLDDEVVPVWDFRLPAGAPILRDASAASISVCGLQELLKYEPDNTLISSAAQRLLARLCSGDYLDFNEACPGVQKRGMVGDGAGMAKNAYTSWGDYFLMEALARSLGANGMFW